MSQLCKLGFVEGILPFSKFIGLIYPAQSHSLPTLSPCSWVWKYFFIWENGNVYCNRIQLIYFSVSLCTPSLGRFTFIWLYLVAYITVRPSQCVFFLLQPKEVPYQKEYERFPCLVKQLRTMLLFRGINIHGIEPNKARNETM